MSIRRFWQTIGGGFAFVSRSIKADRTRERLLLIMFVVLMGGFTIQRFVIFSSMHEKFAGMPAGEIFKAFLYGLRFDLVVTSMLLLPLVMIFMFIPPKYNKRKFARISKGVYCGVISLAAVFGCIADYFFFEEFGKRLNSQIFIYIGYDYIYSSIFHQLSLVLTFITALIIFYMVAGRFYRFLFFKHFEAGGTAGNMLWCFFMLGVLGVCIRGSLGPKSINSGPAYFSGSNSVAQLTLNGLFTLREAGVSFFESNINLSERYDLPGEEKSISITKNLIKTPRDSFRGCAENPLWRETDTGKPRKDYNVVLVIMESIGWPYIEEMGGEEGLMPNLNKLIDKGIFMDRCFSVGHRTTYGLCGIVCGFPDLPEKSITTNEKSVGNIFTLGRLLKGRDYKTMFLYGGQPYYDHRQSFLGSNGFEDFVFENEFPEKTFKTHLGWCDEDLFTAAHESFERQEEPFFGLLLTLSFHRDYEIPEGKIETKADKPYRKQRSAVRYTDWAIGQFMEKAKKASYFDNTIFVFTADHCGGYLNREPRPTAFRVPFLIYAPGIVGNEGERISEICSQTDIAPTIMSFLGGKYSHSFFGSNVLERKAGEGRALIEVGDGTLAYINGTGKMVVVPPYDSKSVLYRYEVPGKLVKEKCFITLKELKQEALAILETADCLYRKVFIRN